MIVSKAKFVPMEFLSRQKIKRKRKELEKRRRESITVHRSPLGNPATIYGPLKSIRK